MNKGPTFGIACKFNGEVALLQGRRVSLCCLFFFSSLPLRHVLPILFHRVYLGVLGLAGLGSFVAGSLFLVLLLKELFLALGLLMRNVTAGLLLFALHL